MSFLDGMNRGGPPPMEENGTLPSPVDSSTAATQKPESQPQHQRLVFADPAAFRYAAGIDNGTVAHGK